MIIMLCFILRKMKEKSNGDKLKKRKIFKYSKLFLNSFLFVSLYYIKLNNFKIYKLLTNFNYISFHFHGESTREKTIFLNSAYFLFFF